MDTDPVPYALGPEDGEAVWFFGGLVTFKATSEQTGGRFVLLEQLARGGTTSTWHAQPGYEESFYLLEGEMTFWVEGEEPLRASAGSFVHVPEGVAHALRVDSDTARFLNLASSAQHEGFIREAGEPAEGRELPPEGPPDLQKVGAAARRHGVEILGPPPGDDA
jgi:quercetin dioxygenase-like cupin family protein